MEVKITKLRVLSLSLVLLAGFAYSNPGTFNQITSQINDQASTAMQLTDTNSGGENKLICSNKELLKRQITTLAEINKPSEYSDKLTIRFDQGTGLNNYNEKESGYYDCRKGEEKGENPEKYYCNTEYYSQGLVLEYERVENNKITETGNVTVNNLVLDESKSIESFNCSAEITR